MHPVLLPAPARAAVCATVKPRGGCPRLAPAYSRSCPSIALSLSAHVTQALWCPLYTRIASPLLRSLQRSPRRSAHSTQSGSGAERLRCHCRACRPEAKWSRAWAAQQAPLMAHSRPCKGTGRWAEGGPELAPTRAAPCSLSWRSLGRRHQRRRRSPTPSAGGLQVGNGARAGKPLSAPAGSWWWAIQLAAKCHCLAAPRADHATCHLSPLSPPSLTMPPKRFPRSRAAQQGAARKAPGSALAPRAEHFSLVLNKGGLLLPNRVAPSTKALAREGAVQREPVQIPELDCLVRGGGGQLAHIGAQQALEHVAWGAAQQGNQSIRESGAWNQAPYTAFRHLPASHDSQRRAASGASVTRPCGLLLRPGALQGCSSKKRDIESGHRRRAAKEMATARPAHPGAP